MYKQYPAFEEACMTRVDRYEKTIGLMERLEDEGRLITYRPALAPISKFEKDGEKIMASYRDGYSQADERIEELERFMETNIRSRIKVG